MTTSGEKLGTLIAVMSLDAPVYSNELFLPI